MKRNFVILALLVMGLSGCAFPFSQSSDSTTLGINTYSHANLGIRLHYPKTLNVVPVLAYPSHIEGIIFGLELPSQPGTNLHSARVLLSVVPGQCPHPFEERLGTVVHSGLQFDTTRRIEYAAGSIGETVSYSTYARGNCTRLSLVLFSANRENYRDAGGSLRRAPRMFRREQYMGIFEEIFRSLEIEK